MTNNRFEYNWPYIIFIIIVGAGALGFCGWEVTTQLLSEIKQGLPNFDRSNLIMAIALDLLFVWGFLALLWKVYADYHTEFTDDAVTRPSLFRLQKIYWSEVTDIKVFNGVGYHIHSRDKRIVVSPYAYKNPDFVIAELIRLWQAGQKTAP